MTIIRLTHTHTGETMHVSPGTLDRQVFLSIHLAEFGIRAELVDVPRYGLASGKRLAETPPRTPLGDLLFGEGTRLAAAIVRGTK